MLVLCSFPPILGHGLVLHFCGFVYGFPLGFVPAFLGGVVGAFCCFTVTRKWVIARPLFQNWLDNNLYWKIFTERMEKAIARRGFKMLLLIRLAGYPYNLSNVLLASMTKSVTLFTFMSATSLSLVKVLIHVYVGSTIGDLSELFGHDGPPPPSDAYTSQIPKLIMAVVTSLIGFGVTLYVVYALQKEVSEVEQNDATARDEERMINRGSSSSSLTAPKPMISRNVDRESCSNSSMCDDEQVYMLANVESSADDSDMGSIENVPVREDGI